MQEALSHTANGGLVLFIVAMNVYITDPALGTTFLAVSASSLSASVFATGCAQRAECSRTGVPRVSPQFPSYRVPLQGSEEY